MHGPWKQRMHLSHCRHVSNDGMRQVPPDKSKHRSSKLQFVQRRGGVSSSALSPSLAAVPSTLSGFALLVESAWSGAAVRPPLLSAALCAFRASIRLERPRTMEAALAALEEVRGGCGSLEMCVRRMPSHGSHVGSLTQLGCSSL
jgi:hypothetical protein